MEINKYNYAVFILSHGRPDKIITYDYLRRSGYTGEIFIICDDEDSTLDRYKELYGKNVIVFNKDNYSKRFDSMDNFQNKKVIVYARNACNDIARSLGLDYFFEYEDDYTGFYFRYIEGDSLRAQRILNLDLVFSLMIKCLEKTKSDTLAFAQGGDFIGGSANFKKQAFKRKAMNSFVFKVEKNPKNDITFVGRMNDDVNTYLSLGKTGSLFFQIPLINIVQLMTQSNSGGNTEIYKDFGTYVKSFYSVMIAPYCCKIKMMGTVNKRIHHSINWNLAVPKIIEESYKKR